LDPDFETRSGLSIVFKLVQPNLIRKTEESFDVDVFGRGVTFKVIVIAEMNGLV
jgi:hypothetical protein